MWTPTDLHASSRRFGRMRETDPDADPVMTETFLGTTALTARAWIE